MPAHQHTRAAGTQNNPEMRKRTGPYGDDVSLLLSGVSRDRLIDERELVANAPCVRVPAGSTKELLEKHSIIGASCLVARILVD